MSSNAEDVRVPRRAWVILLLCGLAGMLFYLDRQTLSVLKTTLKSQLGWSDIDYGWLVAAFMSCYTAGYLLSGRWIDRWGARRMMPIFIGAMSISTVLCGLSNRLPVMAFFRGVLGLAEAGIVPAVIVAIYSWFPPTRRGTASTIREPINIAGQIVATPLAVGFAQMWGWRSAFFTPGLIGVALAVLWWRVERNAPRRAAVTAAAETPPVGGTYREILRRKEVWGVIAARMISDPVWFFLLYWEPGFLQERVGLSLAELGRIGWVPTAVATVSLIGLGIFSDRLIAKSGWTPARSRRVILQGLTIFAPAVLALPFVHDHALAIALLCMARIMMIAWLNFSTLFIADLVPQRLIGSAVALTSAFGSAMGLLSNALVGPAIGAFGYAAVFTVGAALYPLAALILWLTYGRKRPSAAREPALERFKLKAVSIRAGRA